MSYTFIEYTADWRDQVIDLQRHLWGPDSATNASYLRWKYEQNPYLPVPMISLALHDGRAVAMRGAWGACWKLGAGQDPVIIPCGGDTVIAPDHRRLGLLHGLSRTLLKSLEQKGFTHALSLSACKPVLYSSIHDGWQPVTCYDELSRIRPIWKKSWARKLRDACRKMAPQRLRQTLGSGLTRAASAGLPEGIEITSSPRIEAMAQLVQRVETPDTLGHVRNEQYYSWRYLSPLSRYRFLYSGTQKLDGFMVLETKPAYPPGTSIVDWEVETASQFEKLIRAAIHVTGIDDLHIWSASMPAPVRSVLDESGFVVSPYRLNEGYQRSLIIKETGSSSTSQATRELPAPFSGEKAWNLRMIFSDDY